MSRERSRLTPDPANHMRPQMRGERVASASGSPGRRDARRGARRRRDAGRGARRRAAAAHSRLAAHRHPRTGFDDELPVVHACFGWPRGAAARVLPCARPGASSRSACQQLRCGSTTVSGMRSTGGRSPAAAEIARRCALRSSH